MEKIININFHSRVIAIEESAYNALKEYTDALRRHFASEEGSDEIVNDIESRIAELLAMRLKQGATCISMADLDAVIDSIGRIEDIKAAEGAEEAQPQSTAPRTERPVINDRFYRNADDTVIAGVCSGIAARMRIDAVIVRILFVLLFGALFWIYILLWIIVPSQSTSTHITRRLFRNPDDRVISGVCGGLGVYFSTESWKIRLLFTLPFLISIVFGSLHVFTWHLGHIPGFFFGSFGSTCFILYVILWIAVPYAGSATDKMEMRGEKIDINSIKAATQARTGGTAPAVRAGSGLGKAIGILFKAFFLLIAGSIALGLFGALIGVVFAGTVAMPFTDFFLEGWNQYALAWTGVALTLGIPLLALIVFLVRRLMGVRTRRHYLVYVFTVLWFAGVTCALITAGTIASNFSARSMVEEPVPLQQPSAGRLYINVSNDRGPWHADRYNRWFGDWDDADNAFHIISKDSLWLNTVKVNIEQSRDSLFHIYKTTTSRANTSQDAKRFAGNISFPITQQDSVIYLPKGFVINAKDKFRNQQVLVTVEVPLGKTVKVNKDVDEYSWFTINTHGHGVYYTEHWNDDGYDYGTDRDYMMTASGLKKQGDTSRNNGEEEE